MKGKGATGAPKLSKEAYMYTLRRLCVKHLNERHSVMLKD